MQTIKFKPDLFDLVLRGKKLSTVRKGLRDYTLGDVLLETDPSRYTIHGTITKIELKKLSDLTDSDAKKEGYDSINSLLERVKQIYPEIQDDSEITVVDFDHAEGQPNI